MSGSAVAAQGRPAPGASDSLGTFAKSSARLSNQRVTLRRTAQRLLNRREEPAHLQHRTVWCARTVLGESVAVNRSTDGSGARLGGLHTCGSVWTCPVCSAKVTEARRAELLAGMAGWRAAGQGRGVYLLTLTFPHQADEFPLPELLARFAAALKTFKQSTAYKRAGATIGREGGVRSLEVTHADVNGWHPHVHELVFTRHRVEQLDQVHELEDVKGRHLAGGVLDELRGAWVAALGRHGLGGRSAADTWAHSFDWRPGDYAADYVAKFGRDLEGWSVADELTRSHAKAGARSSIATERGRDTHSTPFQLLAWAAAGDARAAQLFRDFAEAFEGKRMLSWSPRLKAKLGIAELSDEEIAERLGGLEPLPDEEKVGRLSVEQYATLYSRDAVGELLELVTILGPECEDRQRVIDDFCRLVEGRVPTSSARLRYRGYMARELYEYAPASVPL